MELTWGFLSHFLSTWDAGGLWVGEETGACVDCVASACELGFWAALDGERDRSVGS